MIFNGNYIYNDNLLLSGSIYRLKVVLIYRGFFVYSGYYIVYILDESFGVWYKFNDEEIIKMKGFNFYFGIEEDLQEIFVKQKGKVFKGYYFFRNVYMLVYIR